MWKGRRRPVERDEGRRGEGCGGGACVMRTRCGQHCALAWAPPAQVCAHPGAIAPAPAPERAGHPHTPVPQQSCTNFPVPVCPPPPSPRPLSPSRTPSPFPRAAFPGACRRSLSEEDADLQPHRKRGRPRKVVDAAAPSAPPALPSGQPAAAGSGAGVDVEGPGAGGSALGGSSAVAASSVDATGACQPRGRVVCAVVSTATALLVL